MKEAKSILVLGGARSGKSSYAEGLAEEHAGPLIYIATAQAWDDEMKDRIARHVERRGDRWQTIEATTELATAISANNAANSFVLVDCLTLWLTNILLAERNIEEDVAALIGAVEGFAGTLVMVSNEVGQGIVPDNALARRFRDEAGILNQKMARAADSAVLVAAGLPLTLK